MFTPSLELNRLRNVYIREMMLPYIGSGKFVYDPITYSP